MAGGEGNPLGARAIYLGSTVYRIHGTNMPETIGQKVSSGCIRMLNADVIDLYSRVDVGTKIIVLPNYNNLAAFAASPQAPIPPDCKSAPAFTRASRNDAHLELFALGHRADSRHLPQDRREI